MSFHDKITALMARPGQDLVAKDDVPWWLKVAGRGLGTFGGFIAISFGFWECIGIVFLNYRSFLAGIWQVLIAFIVLCIEAPCCCMFIDHVQRLSDTIDNRPHWNRALLYVVTAIPPILLDFTLATVFGSGLIFATGIIYGMMALGRKASAEDMRAAAAAAATSKQQPTSNMRDGLVVNAQPISFTGAPVFDSNV